MKVRIKRFDTSLPLPQAEPGAACFDLVCREEIIIEPHTIGLVAVNNAIEVPDGYLLLVAARSSTPWKKGLMLANGIGIIDPFFSGDKDEVRLQFYNITDQPVKVERGEVLAQATLIKHEPVEWVEVETFGKDGHGGYHTT